MPTWNIDPAHTDISFSAKHMMVTTVRGKFHSVDGQVVIDETEPSRSRADITIDPASLSTGFDARDQHLRSPDFFDVERFPAIRFVSTTIRPLSEDRFRVEGELTIRDVARAVVFDAEFLGFYVGLQGNRRAGFSAHLTLDRKDWGLTWNVALERGGWLVGDKISIDLDVAVELPVAASAVDQAGANAA
jgi:polyisoprenoid-binding protein YceI